MNVYLPLQLELALPEALELKCMHRGEKMGLGFKRFVNALGKAQSIQKCSDPSVYMELIIDL